MKKHEENFYKFSDDLYSSLSEGEDLTLSLHLEDTFFARFNQAKVRQTTSVVEGELGLSFVRGKKKIEYNVGYTGDREVDLAAATVALKECQALAPNLMDDPFCPDTINNGTSSENHTATLPSHESSMEKVLTPASSYDLAGIYTSGWVVRANTNSKGQKHWFSTESCSMDYSLYTAKQRAVKGMYATTNWSDEEYQQNISGQLAQLELMDREKKIVPRGKYRVYLSPGAVSEIVGIINWQGLSYSCFKQGRSAFKKMSDENLKLSEKFSLSEDFSLGMTARFNNLGEQAPERLALIDQGVLENYLVSSKASKEYGVESNFANQQESMRSPNMSTGDLKREDILKEIGTGLYLSNLHYLNWSDIRHGRITGMTRFACFWVEDGEIISPIQDMRFDENMYHFFGDGLKRVTDFSEIAPNTSTYGHRSIGGMKTPGVIVDDFSFTL